MATPPAIDPYAPHRPVVGKPVIKQFVSPNIEDRILVVRKDSRMAGYVLPKKGDKFGGPEAQRFSDFLFATAAPADQTGWVDLFFINERANQDDYNFITEYPWVSKDYPRRTRSYVILRSELVPANPAEVDSEDSKLQLVDQKVTRADDPIIDSLFVGIQKVFERVPAPTGYSQDRPEHSLPFNFRVAVPAATVRSVEPGPAQVPVLQQGDWHVDEDSTSAFRKTVEKIQRILPADGVTLVNQKLTRDQQLETVTETWKNINQTIVPTATMLEATMDQVGDGSTILSEGVVPDIFPNEKYSTAIPDLVPPEFRQLSPVRSISATEEGQAEMPNLGIGELDRSEEQTTEFQKRISITNRDLDQLPVTLVDQKTSEAFGFGGVLDVVRTLDKVSQTVEEGLNVVSSSVKNLGSGMTLKETEQLANSSGATLKLLTGGSGYTEDPTVEFDGGSAGTIATATASLSQVDPEPETPDDYFTQTLQYAYDGDENGLFFFLGAQSNNGVWINPVNVGAVVVTHTPDYYRGTSAQIVDRAVSNVALIKQSSGFIVFDLGEDTTFQISKMSWRARTGSSSPTNDINLSGSADGSAWSPIIITALNTNPDKWSTSINGAGISVPNTNYYRYLRVQRTGDWLVLGELEFYGVVKINLNPTGGTPRNAVTSIDITDPGAGYLTAPEVVFSTGGAQAQAFIFAGQVSRIDILNGGNYPDGTPPTITIASPDADSGSPVATAHVTKSVASVSITANGSDYTSPPAVHIDGDAAAYSVLGFGIDHVDVVDAGDGYTSNPSITMAGGATATASRRFGVDSANVTSAGSGYTSDPVVTPASGAAVFKANRGLPLLSITILTNGAGYSSAPAVVFSDGSAAATAVLGFAVAEIDLTSPGTGYSSPPDVLISGDGGGAAATARLTGFGIGYIQVTSGGSYDVAPAVAINGGGGVGATATAVVGFGIDTIVVDAGGSGYITAPDVSIAGDGSGAMAHAVLTADVVTSIVVDAPGNGYTTPPTITLSGGSGTGATAHSTLLSSGGTINRIDVGTPGSGYTSIPSIVLSSGSGAATAILTTDQGIALTLTTPGFGYTSAPTVTLSGGGGTGATATTTLETLGSIKSVDITDSGSGYVIAPLITFTGGSGTGATVIGALDTTAAGPIASIDVVFADENYTAAPALAISGGGGTGPAATAVLATAGKIKAITVTTPGTSYTLPPTVVVSGGGGAGGVARAVLKVSGTVRSIILTNNGSGYDDAPDVLLIGGGGTGAAATTVLSATGSVTSITLVSPGLFVTAPTVIIVGDGTGATAVYHLPEGWPTLVEQTTDPTDGIIVTITKKLVAAGTPLPAGFAEMKPLDKWRSVQIVSKVDPSSLPPPDIYKTTQRISLPDTLISVIPIWDSGTAFSTKNTVHTTNPSAASTASVTVHGSILVLKRHGFRGAAIARVIRTFFFGAPPDASVPLPTIIQPSSGTALIRGQTVSNSAGGSNVIPIKNIYGQPAKLGDIIGYDTTPGEPTVPIYYAGVGTSSGVITNSSSGSNANTTQLVDINNVLTAGYSLSSSNTVGNISGNQTAQIVRANATANFTVNIPPSCPSSIPEGMAILYDVKVEKWRFDIFVRTIVYIYGPAVCGATSGGGCS